MQIQNLIDQLMAFLPSVIGALVLLAVGWLIALLVAGGVRAGMGRLEVASRVSKWVSGAEPADPAVADRWVGRSVFWLIMLFVLVGFFQVLGLSGVAGPITGFLNEIFTYAPRLIGPAILLVVAWVVAVVLRLVVNRGLKAVKLDERIRTDAGLETEPGIRMSDTIANAVYWLTFLVFLPAILGALELGGLLDPVKELVNELLNYLPNLLAAALILLIGWFVARVVRSLVVNFLSAVGTDKLPERLGLQSAVRDQQLSGLIGLIVYALILIPVLIGALQALQLEAITQPASDMLRSFLDAVPVLFGAAVLLAIAYVVARILASLATRLLEGVGFNQLFGRLGLGDFSVGDKTSPAQVVGYLVLVGVMLFALIEALSLIGFDAAAAISADFLVFAGNVALGLFIIGLGLFIGNLAAQAIRSTKVSQAAFLSTVARIAILVLAFAMGLKQMGIAEEVILLAFGISLGAVAVAAAIAFGIGGRDVAKEQVERWTKGGPPSSSSS